jgi:hypothetical protein
MYSLVITLIATSFLVIEDEATESSKSEEDDGSRVFSLVLAMICMIMAS